MNHFDVMILGAGSAGYNAARVLNGAKRRIALVDKGPWGGLCILRGCMPTKAMLRSTEVLHLVREASEFGVSVGPVSFDFAALMERQARLVAGFQDYRLQGIRGLSGATVIEGEARFVGANAVQVGETTYTADKILIATGSRPHVPHVPGLEAAGFLTSDDVMALRELPESLIVWGGGVIALELGQFFARLGVSVTMVIRADHVLSKEDPDVSGVLEAALRADGVHLVPRVHPLEVRREGNTKVLVAQVDGERREFAACEILVATGRVPNLAPLNLEAAAVSVQHGAIQVNAHMQTSNPALYAAGDCLGDPYLVHVAIQQAEVAARHMLGGTEAIDYRLLASAVFTEPNFARVGLSERDAMSRQLEVVVGKYEFADLGKAECMGATAMQGFVKLIALASTGELVGAEIVGPEGADLIHELIVAMEFRCTAQRLMTLPHLHPTLAEIITYPAEEIAEAIALRGAPS